MRKLRLFVALGMTAVLLSGSLLTATAQQQDPVEPTGWPPSMWEIAYQWCWENIADPDTCGTQPRQAFPTMWDIIYAWCWENVGTPEACGTQPRPMSPHMWVAVFNWCTVEERDGERIMSTDECWSLLPMWPPSIWVLAYQWCWQNVGTPEACGTLPPRPGPRR